MANQTISLRRQNDNTVTLDGLESSVGAFINDATVRMILRDSSMNIVADEMLTYVAGSNGRYQGSINSNTNMVVGGQYTLDIQAASGDMDGKWTPKVQILERTS